MWIFSYQCSTYYCNLRKKLDELYKSVWGEDYGDDTIAFDDDNV